MNQFEEHDNQVSEQWHSLAARKRLDLSTSVEEAMRDVSLQDEPEENDENDSSSSHPLQGVGLIPPRLSLQTKPLLALHPDMTAETPRSLPVELHANRVRMIPPPFVRSTETAHTTQRQHVNRRTTKVRLQVVPPPEEALNSEASSVPIHEAITNPDLPVIEQSEQLAASPVIPETHAGLSGASIFESGQRDMAVANTHVTASSVVVVVLTGNPGPVVVHYVSLLPGVGFTVHLSAPAKNATPFNYALL
jgi:hypothetical protein